MGTAGKRKTVFSVRFIQIVKPELQVKRGNRDNLEILFLISHLNQKLYCDPSLELSQTVLMRGHNMF